ncbi:hypothetical protein P4534_19445 [Peribacillus butanolivorans]|uniref:hypothetical protein n=1 Tax=Peribacillus butanolivorans TaxID=421767 RepID=UPI002E1E7181|nr:hypothetical protein [Peribacillus butanolivorans]
MVGILLAYKISEMGGIALLLPFVKGYFSLFGDEFPSEEVTNKLGIHLLSPT